MVPLGRASWVRGFLPQKILRSEMAVGGGFLSVSSVIITTSHSIDFCGKKSLKQSVCEHAGLEISECEVEFEFCCTPCGVHATKVRGTLFPPHLPVAPPMLKTKRKPT